jgi:hypothetical protein
LLGRLALRPSVIALGWHVDYWDHLGWHDRFASRTATARQQAYAHRLGSGVFTPALVVNGTRIVVGSDRASVEAAIDGASVLPVAMTLKRAGDSVTADVDAAIGAVSVQHIIYDAEQATDIGAGENEGERLREYRVVREVETLAQGQGAARRFTLKPPGRGQGQVILLQSADLRLLGAADLPPRD